MDAQESPASAAHVSDEVKGDGAVGFCVSWGREEFYTPDFVVDQTSPASQGCAALFQPPLASFVPSNRFVGDCVLGAFPLDFQRLARVGAEYSDRFTEQPHLHTSLRRDQYSKVCSNNLSLRRRSPKTYFEVPALSRVRATRLPACLNKASRSGCAPLARATLPMVEEASRSNCVRMTLFLL